MTMPYWTRVLAQAKKREKNGLKPFTQSQIDKAGEWQTCACAGQDKRIPRGFDGAPLDTKLWLAGQRFYVEVYSQDVKGSHSAMHSIERHATRLLREQARNQKGK